MTAGECRPILFSGPMVRAILEGRKTQTRRAVKPQPGWDGHSWVWESKDGTARWSGDKPEACALVHGFRPHCPYGQPGDRLWVREAFNVARPLRDSEGVVDDEMLWPGRLPREDPRGKRLMDDWCVGYAADGCEGKMRPSIFMPRWASRLTLEVTGVRVERLQDVSEEDARAEGAAPVPAIRRWEDYMPERESSVLTHCTAKESYFSLWESINGTESLASNPWVWVVSFRRLP